MSNLMFLVASSFGLATVHWSHWELHHARIWMSFCAFATGLLSGLFHGTNGYGKTGALDVGSIFPLILSAIWDLIWNMMVALHWYKHHSLVFAPWSLDGGKRLRRTQTMYYDPMPWTKWPIVMVCVVMLTVFSYVLELQTKWHVDWETKQNFLLFSSVSVALVGVGMLIFMEWKQYLWRPYGGEWSVTKQTLVALAGIGLLLMLAVLAEELKSWSCLKHGIHRHVIPASALGLILVYYHLFYENVHTCAEQQGHDENDLFV